MKRSEQVKKVCQDWHGGQWSAVYQFGSSGIYLPENHLRYLKEIQENREPEYYPYPTLLSKKEDNRLKAAQNYFIKEGERHNITTGWKKHSVYGYNIPYIVSADPNILRKIIPLHLPI